MFPPTTLALIMSIIKVKVVIVSLISQQFVHILRGG